MKGYLGGIVRNVRLSVSLQHKVVSFRNPFLELNRISDDFVDLCCPSGCFQKSIQELQKVLDLVKPMPFFFYCKSWVKEGHI